MLRLAAVVCILAVSFSPCRCQEIPLQPSPEDKPGSINFMTFSPDSEHLLTCSNEKIHIWDATTCELKQVLESPSDDRDIKLRGVDISPDGKLVASLLCGPRNERVPLLWDIQGDAPAKSLKTAWHQGTAVHSDLEFSPDGKSLWATDGPIVYTWDTTSGDAQQYEVSKMLHGRLRFINDTSALVVHGIANLHVHDPKTGKQFVALTGMGFRWGDILGSGDRFTAYRQNGELLLGEVVGSKITKRFHPLSGDAGFALRLNNDHLLVYTTTGQIERWDLKTVKCTGRLPRRIAAGNFRAKSTIEYGRPERGYFNVHHSTPLAISPDGSRLAICAGRQFALLPVNWQEP